LPHGGLGAGTDLRRGKAAYGHISAFARGIEPGKRVRQGQVIGFVGSTGLSTGAHVRYEIVVNGRFVDPMRIRLPRGRVLEGPILAGFEKERERVEGMMIRKPGAPARVAQTSLGNYGPWSYCRFLQARRRLCVVLCACPVEPPSNRRIGRRHPRNLRTHTRARRRHDVAACRAEGKVQILSAHLRSAAATR
jgi:hypothetical protein